MAIIIRNPQQTGDDKSTEADEVWVQPDGSITGRILGYFGRTSDRSQIRSKVLRRYFTGIKKTKSDAGTEIETYTKELGQKKMDEDMIETVSIGFGHNVSNAMSTMFTEPGQSFTIVSEAGADVAKASEFLTDFRETSQYLDGLVQANREGVQMGSSALWLQFTENRIKYRTVDPGKVKVCFHPALYSGGLGDENLRPVNYQEIEDATCVIVETGTADSDTKSYVAYFARSFENPYGRYVTYTSGGDGKDVPAPGTDGTYDWKIPGTNTIANPLSWYASQNIERNIPEYPLAIFYGGHVRRDRLFPLSLSLLEEALEADVAASHIRSTSQDYARGTLALEREQSAMTLPLPRNLRGDVALMPGQKITAPSGDAGAGDVAWRLLKESNIAAAQGFGVPDFYVSSEDHTLEASSGVALKVRATPLEKFRNEQVTINRPSVDKVFEVEKAFLDLYIDTPEVTQLVSCTQQWDPGPLDYPEDEGLIVENVIKLVDRGFYDTIEAIQTIYQLPSEADAIDKYEALKKRGEQYPPLNKSALEGEEETPAPGMPQDEEIPEEEGEIE
jgi:hypothetical protein